MSLRRTRSRPPSAEPGQSLVLLPRAGSGPPPTAARHARASPIAVCSVRRTPSRYIRASLAAVAAARTPPSPAGAPADPDPDSDPALAPATSRNLASAFDSHARAASSPPSSCSRSAPSAPHSAAAAAARPPSSPAPSWGRTSTWTTPQRPPSARGASRRGTWTASPRGRRAGTGTVRTRRAPPLSRESPPPPPRPGVRATAARRRTGYRRR